MNASGVRPRPPHWIRSPECVIARPAATSACSHRRRELHIAALPFPSYQGTQAALRHMLDARAEARRDVALFTYGASGYELSPRYPWHRTPEAPRVSLRSGPSWAKVMLDARMGLQLRALVRRTEPRVLIAHHVEAMSIAHAAPRVARVFFAHTDLGAELPSYAPARYGRALGLLGHGMDRALCASADALAAISPALARTLAAVSGRHVRYVPTPWPLPAAITPDERVAARARLGLSAAAKVVLYAGNLDAYQDAHSALEALQLLAAGAGPQATLLLATRSEQSAFLRRALELGVPFRTCELAGEGSRRLFHAAADCAVVPRAVPGGLPMKLLDALARGLPCVITPCASAGLALDGCALHAQREGAAGLALALARLFREAGLRAGIGERARAYVAREHTERQFGQALDAVVREALARRQ